MVRWDGGMAPWLEENSKKGARGFYGTKSFSFAFTLFVPSMRREETRKRRAESHLTSPSTSHSNHLASIAAVPYDDDSGASERSKRAKLDLVDSKIGWCIFPILESGRSSLRYDAWELEQWKEIGCLVVWNPLVAGPKEALQDIYKSEYDDWDFRRTEFLSAVRTLPAFDSWM